MSSESTYSNFKINIQMKIKLIVIENIFKFRYIHKPSYMAVICSFEIFFNLLNIMFNLLRTLILRGIRRMHTLPGVFVWLINQKKHNRRFFICFKFCYDLNCFLELLGNNTPINQTKYS